MFQRFIALLLACCLAQLGFAQLEPQATHFMYNQMFYNPATAGKFGVPVVQAMYRAQWVGLEGAPTTGLCSWQNRIMSDRVGVGANLMYNSIGVHKRVQGDFSYSYQTPLLNGVFSGGMQASFRYLQQNWADERLHATQSVVLDQAIPGVMTSKLIPNFGVGLYFETSNYYAGFSVPRLVDNSVDFAEYGAALSREPRHFYASAGFMHGLAGKAVMSYHLLGNYVKSQPFDLDINATLHWNQKLNAGLSYRAGGDQRNQGDALNVILGVQANDQLLISAAYDFTLSKLKAYSAGSVEVAVRYFIRPNAGLFGSTFKEIETPRPVSGYE
jgi:type IX secretion system PorP/SprF family membrane protein